MNPGIIVRLLVILSAVIVTLPGAENGNDRVRIQLNYYHQFQFAGIYAAIERGYFRDEALEVEVSELSPGVLPLSELESGRAQFAAYDAKVIDAWAHGKAVALVAVILQRNPSVMLVPASSPHLTLADLLKDPKARIAGPVDRMDPELRLAIAALGRDADTAFPRAKTPKDLAAFAAGELDALHAYLTNEPFKLRELGFESRALRYGLESRSPFFGDVVICRADLFNGRPDLVARFRRAVLRGWNWALDNRALAVDMIATRWPSAHMPKNAVTLAQEAEAIDALIDRQVIPLGSVSEQRLESIAGLLRSAGLPGLVRRDLVWREANPERGWIAILVWALGIAAAISLGLLGFAWATRRRLATTAGTNQRLMELAEAFFLFHAQVDEGSRLRFVDASPSMSAILGGARSSYLGDPDALIRQVLPEDRQELLLAMRRAVSERQPMRCRFRITHGDGGKPRHLLIHAVPITDSPLLAFDGLVLDLTAEAEAHQALLEVQARLQNAQKNESLGLLAGGVAHDFNNLLGAIRGNAEMALGKLPSSHEAHPKIQRVLQAADRAAGLVRQILAYAGKGTIELRPVDIAEECRVLGDLLRHAVPKDVAIKLKTDGELPRVMFDPAQLQQVLINLIVNAAESYQGRPGTVDIRIAKDPSGGVKVEIEDRGCGMDADTQRRMFEPYFTTKPKGHGLGLAAVQGIIASSGATLACRSTPGSGTRFTIVIPPARRNSASDRVETPVPAAGRHLLVVDDDELVRETTAQMARELGYSVEIATGAADARRLLAGPDNRFDAAVVDCAMPDGNGVDIVRERRLAGDRRPMVLISGMVEAARIGTGILDRRTRFLAKPFSRSMLDRTLRILLRGDRSSDQESSSTFAAMQRESSIQMAIRPDDRQPPG